jgi:tape measure domain-containing protein
MTGLQGKIASRFNSIGKEAGSQMSNGVQASGKKFTFGMASLWGITSNLASRAIDGMARSFSAGVQRFDTMNNYPKIMQNLGYSAQDAQKSIKQMSDAVTGLPTGLDAIATSTKMFAPMSKDLNQATKTAIALNDAFLASGASTVDVERGMRQVSQIFAKGKVDLQSWRTLQETMPSVLSQVSKQLGVESGNTTELYNRMKEGKISIDQFRNALIEMDEKGGAGFKSLRDQAFDATGGLQTSLENLSNRMARLWQAILSGDGISSALEGVFSTINGLIRKFIPMVTKMIAEGLPQAITSMINVVRTLGASILPLVPELLQSLSGVALRLIDGLIDIVKTMGKQLPEIIIALPRFLPALMQGLITLITSLAEGINQALPIIANTVPQIIDAIVGALLNETAITALLQAGIQLLIALINAIPYGIEAISKALPTIIDAIVNTLTSPQFIQMMIDCGVKLIIAIADAIGRSIWAITKAAGEILGKFLSVLSPDKLIDVGVNLVKGLWDGINNVTGWIIDKIKGFGKSIMDGIKGFFGIKSPSKKMANEVGRYISEGLAKGVVDNVDVVNKAMDTLSNEIMKDSSALTVGANVAGAYDPLALGEPNQGAIYPKVIVNQNIDKVGNQVDVTELGYLMGYQASQGVKGGIA